MSSQHTYNETTLVQELVQGSAVAFRALYTRYFDPLFTQTKQITKDAQVAEDITQNVFMRLWERRGNLETMRK